MSRRKGKKEKFVDALSADLAGEVLEDDEVLEEELADLGSVDDMIARTRANADRIIGARRRELLKTRTIRSSQHRGTYDHLSMDELVDMARRRAQEAGDGATVQHRELRSMSETDLRSMLEEWDEAEAEDRGN